MTEAARNLALFLVYDRPGRANERPGLARTFFAQRCVSDEQLNQTIEALRTVGAYVELFEGEEPFLAALSSGRIQALDRTIKLAYNGIEGGISIGGFEPGRKSLIPAIADSYGIVCSNSNAYACALGRHKFHYLTILRAFGISTPRVWHYRLLNGWICGMSPPSGTTVIAKSTYESWSVGVTERSIFEVDDACDDRVRSIAQSIGQSVTVQEFVSGPEVCVPVFALPDCFTTPAMEVVLGKAPGDPTAVMTIDDNLTKGAVLHRPFAGHERTVRKIAARAIQAFEVLELDAFARIDFRIDDNGEPWIIDVGVSPGIGSSSSAFTSLSQLGFDHASFLRVVIAASLASKGVLASSPAKIQPQAF